MFPLFPRCSGGTGQPGTLVPHVPGHRVRRARLPSGPVHTQPRPGRPPRTPLQPAGHEPGSTSCTAPGTTAVSGAPLPLASALVSARPRASCHRADLRHGRPAHPGDLRVHLAQLPQPPDCPPGRSVVDTRGLLGGGQDPLRPRGSRAAYPPGLIRCLEVSRQRRLHTTLPGLPPRLCRSLRRARPPQGPRPRSRGCPGHATHPLLLRWHTPWHDCTPMKTFAVSAPIPAGPRPRRTPARGQPEHPAAISSLPAAAHRRRTPPASSHPARQPPAWTRHLLHPCPIHDEKSRKRGSRFWLRDATGRSRIAGDGPAMRQAQHHPRTPETARR